MGELLFSDGARRPLQPLYADRPLALVFLRHLGCVFCRRMASQLVRRPDWNVCLVTMSEPVQAARFASELAIPFPIICDPGCRLYDHFGFRRAQLGGLIGPRVVREVLAGMGQGMRMGRPVGDPWRLGGAVVFDTDGTAAWVYRSKDAADNPPLDAIEAALGERAPGREDGEGVDRGVQGPA